MKISIFANRKSRTKIFSVITALVIIAVLALNMLLTYLTSKKTAYLDLTPEGLYSATDAMIEACAYVEELPNDIKITFCADPDILLDSYLMRAPYLLAKRLENEFEKITVETVNVAINPTAVAKYKTTALSEISAVDIIVSYGDRYRIINANRFWFGSETTGTYTAFDGEYELASIFKSLTNREKPVAYFISNHGEQVYDPENTSSEGSKATAQFANLLMNRGLEIRTLDLSKIDKIPDDCALLIINNPKSDFICDENKLNQLSYVSETEMVDRYLVAGNGSIIVALDYDLRNFAGYAEAEAAGKLDSFEPLKNLKEFLRGWGFKFSDTQVKDPENAVDGDSSQMLGVYETNTDSYGNAIYGDYASSASAPKMMLFNTGYIECSFGLDSSMGEQGSSYTNIIYDGFLYTSDKAIGYSYNKDKGEYDDEATGSGKKSLASVVARKYTDPTEAVATYSYVFCANSKEFFSNELLSNTAYANYDVVSALVSNLVRTDSYASTELGGSSGNSPNRTGKPLVSTEISSLPTASNKGLEKIDKTVYSIIIYAVPTAIAVLGIVMLLKRKVL